MRTYQEALSYLYRLQRFGVILGLDNIRRLLRLLGNPEQNLRFIHIAGTNGKGSVAAMLSSIFRAAGYRTGLYTSPHLVSLCERLQLNGISIGEADVARLTQKLLALTCQVEKESGTSPTFFEVITAMAAQYFHEQKTDIVIWETGLGGRLDATNVIVPLVSVITNIALDHTETLGKSLVEIAAEKCGIIKQRIPVVTAADGDALAVIRAQCKAQQAPLILVKRPYDGELSLAGEHQALNAAIAVAAAEQCGSKLAVAPHHIRDGLAKTEWPARFQYIEPTFTRPALLLDGAHNPAAADVLRALLEKHFANRPLIFILGILRDKDYVGICQTLAPLADEIFTARVKNPRAADPAELVRVCSRRAFTQKATDAGDFPTAWELACAAATKRRNPVVVVTGSLFLAGEALAHLKISVFGKIATEELAMTAQ